MRVMSWLPGACLVWLAMTMPAHARLDEAEALAILTAQPQAEEAAWQALAGQGLPIIEPHPGDDSLARVTFAYRGHDGVSEVRLDSVINAPLAADFVDDYREDFTLPLSRLNGSDLWTITLDVKRDVQASYSFLVGELSGVYRRSGSSQSPPIAWRGRGIPACHGPGDGARHAAALPARPAAPGPGPGFRE